MASGAKWRVVDHTAKSAKREAAKKHPTLKVGVTETTASGPHPKSVRPVGDIAFFNEFGTMTSPARSFVRDWVDGNLDKITKQIGTDLLRVLFTPTEQMSQALARRGKEYRRLMVKRIQERIPPPNRPATLAQKVGDIPLIDTETLLDAIIYEVK